MTQSSLDAKLGTRPVAPAPSSGDHQSPSSAANARQEGSGSEPNHMGNVPDFVFFLSTDWERFHRPKMIEALARRVDPSGAKVLAINRPIFLISTAIRKPAEWLRWISNPNDATKVGPNLFTFTPLLLEHELAAYYLPTVRRLNHWLLSRQIHSAMRRIGFTQPSRVAWVYHPYQFGYLGAVGEDRSVYECYDEHIETLDKDHWTRRVISDLEIQLFDRADVSFVTSNELYEAKRTFAGQLFLSLNAADASYFGRVQDETLRIADMMQGVPRPIIGCLGNIHEHIDIALLKYVAETRPDWTVVMIGTQQQPWCGRSPLFAAFRSLPNVRLLGWIPQHGDLHSYCKAFDVCVIPFSTNSALMRYVNPNRLHEYVAMGKPVVSTDVPGVRSHAGLIKIAQTREEFVRQIEESLREDNHDRILERLRVAKENSWDKRVEAVLSVIEQTSHGRRAGVREPIERLPAPLQEV